MEKTEEQPKGIDWLCDFFLTQLNQGLVIDKAVIEDGRARALRPSRKPTHLETLC